MVDYLVDCKQGRNEVTMFYSPGSVRVINEKTNKWQVRFTYYEEDNGHRRKRQLARNFTAGSRREAKRIASQIHMELERAAQAAAEFDLSIHTDIVLSDFARDYIDKREASRAIERTTAANYRSSIKHVLRHLPDLPIGLIKADMVRKMDEELLGDGLAPDTVSKAHRFLKQLLDEAEAVGLIDRNPITRAVKPPKRQHREPASLAPDERKRLLSLLDTMEDTNLTLAIRLGLAAGLRNEEALGLRWENVSFEDGTVRIRHALTVASGKTVLKDPKTTAGLRDIPLEVDLRERLFRRYTEICFDVGRREASHRFVLGDAGGGFYHPTALIKEFRSFARLYDIRDAKGVLATYCCLRHTFATTLLQNGVDPKTVASLMGHSNVAETLNTYASTDPAARAAAGSVVERIMAER